jgi:hypothetical protein
MNLLPFKAKNLPRTPGLYIRVCSPRIRGCRESRDFQLHRAGDVFGWLSKLLSPVHCLGAALIVVALTASAQGQSTVTLAWDAETGGDIAAYRLYQGGTSRTYTNVIAAGNATTATVSSLLSGATYFFALTAVGTNGLESDYSSEVSYTVPLPTNPPPTIALTSPASGAAYAAPATVPLTASVTANGHAITQVQFFNGATLLGTVAAAPYSFSWNSVSTGTYSLTAKAVYDSGSTVACTSVSVTVTNLLTPSIALTSPLSGATYAAPATVPLTASVTANGHAITQVQFYNGTTLLGTVAAAPYSFSWSNVSVGSYSLTAKVVYDAGSTATSALVNVTCFNATSVVTIWPTTAVPGSVDDGPDSAVELGVKFRSDVAGSITGIRFYKATANTGTHSGHLWSSTGTPLASATFTGESASGWQQVNFATPVAIAANTVYVASYYAAVGHYSADVNYFASKGADNSPLHALTNGVSGGNGVYAYGASGTFPNQTWNTANYWVDLVFQPGVTATLTNIAVTPANPTLLVGATQQFTATGTYSDGSTKNVTSQATWTSSSPAVVTVNTTGFATAVSAGATTLSAALNGVTGSSTPRVIVNPPTIVLTSPLNGASYTTPATINLAASVTTNGHAITKVQFYNGTTLLGEDTSTPYTWSWNSANAGTYSLSAVLVYDSGSTLASSLVSISVTGLPAPWQTADIGSVGLAGSAGISGGLYTVAGAGNITGRADSFRFLYQTMSGDGLIQTRISSAQNTGTAGDIGVMIRESLTSGSDYASMGVLPSGKFRWQSRGSTGGTTSSTTSGAATPPNAWARLVRTNGMFYGYKSTNGTNWTQVGSRTITMATNIYVGLAVASGSSTVLNTSTFTNVTVVP